MSDYQLQEAISIATLVLVVEDNPDVLFNIMVSLEANNYIVEMATNGKEAANKLLEMNLQYTIHFRNCCQTCSSGWMKRRHQPKPS